MTKKRDLFSELVEGIDALAEQRVGKRTLRTHAMKVKPVPTITARELAKVREDMNLSRGLFAGYLRTNVRTLENWEQGTSETKCSSRLANSYATTIPRHDTPFSRDIAVLAPIWVFTPDFCKHLVGAGHSRLSDCEFALEGAPC